MHGQVILGLMVMQDITAVMAIAIMPAFDPRVSDGPSIGETVGYILMWFALLLLFLYVFHRFCLLVRARQMCYALSLCLSIHASVDAFVCVCVCVFVCLCVCLCVCVYTHTHTQTHINIHI